MYMYQLRIHVLYMYVYVLLKALQFINSMYCVWTRHCMYNVHVSNMCTCTVHCSGNLLKSTRGTKCRLNTVREGSLCVFFNGVWLYCILPSHSLPHKFLAMSLLNSIFSTDLSTQKTQPLQKTLSDLPTLKTQP